ncbi:pectate lyase superfamily protein-domain-containing protein [Plectosphaerella plurivora]|uniref:Pectate lyase superfamily protein-domain-containing protein n=1 Tax=Plectosphaerella plurivora TaxID=936078 RepID=A0A9P8VLQ1_9PEZI|nr:pectate lyase superfamily protein-domain-containing protein [Plectosphaerella plurivora]
MRRRNKARVQRPVINQYKVADADELIAKATLAAPLELDETVDDKPSTGNSSSLSRLAAVDDDDDTAASPYSIPQDLAKAAALMAEASSQVPEGNHEELAAAIIAKYRNPLVNDTNIPPSKQRPLGRLGAYGIGEGFAELHSNSLRDTVSSETYWMAQMEQLGSAPFAPDPDYKVWRNVKDYGATGDGRTDDTAAINRAISDGQRCGPDCGTSTVVPAVVYFPSGTYLVSSSIIQYYNTQFLGDPNDVPTILAASSFVGLGVITSSPYVSDNESWYLNTANFLRSIRNFKIDIRLTDPYSYVCGIHWQVSQATSLENIEFFMLFNSDVPDNTQQGIYMENGSGGFMGDLTFVGGNIGAYFGNQQFTTDHLVFVYCKTGVQVNWDWAWTMHDFIFETCGTGLNIIGYDPNAQTVGSLLLADAIFASTPIAVKTSLRSEKSTSLSLQNIAFFNVDVGVQDDASGAAMLNGGDRRLINSWGYGRIVESDSSSVFRDGGSVPVMPRTAALTGEAYEIMRPNLYARRRPKYYNEPLSNILNVKALGARGDGKTDDTAVLNSILAGAVNTSSIVHFPYGVYMVTDTLRVPIGSRIIGQAWSQIMGTGARFEDEGMPRPVVRVAEPGDVGIIEIQDMMFTVSGPTAGAVMLQWNAQEGTQGSAGIWDTHIRVGGAVGSKLQASDCPKQTGGEVNDNCKAASLMVHLTHDSTAYMENVWAWVADHDLDTSDRKQVNVYVGRGMLIQSRLAYLWGTSVEHATMYQYQLAGARNILMSMIQTETPYFQPMPKSPLPYRPGIFPSDPRFDLCDDDLCPMAWGARILDSHSIYILSAGIYSWFHAYDQACVDTDSCQQRAFEVVQSYDLWLFNLCTKAIIELISPHNGVPTMAADNKNGLLSSVLAWLRGARQPTAPRDFDGFRVYTSDEAAFVSLSDNCKMALTERIECHEEVQTFQSLGFRASLENQTLTDLVCQASCGTSLEDYVSNVRRFCGNAMVKALASSPHLYGSRMHAGFNETCLKDKTTGRYCNDVIAEFTIVDSINDMPQDELCSPCNVERLAMMQRTPYSSYDGFWKQDLEYIYSQCGLSGPTNVQLPDLDLIGEDPLESDFCLTEEWYTTSRAGESCEEIAWAHKTSSASLFMANHARIISCSSDETIPAGKSLCIPPSCGTTYLLNDDDTCASIERNESLSLGPGDVARYNSWVGFECSLLQNVSYSYGAVICLGPLLGEHELEIPGEDTTRPPVKDGYSDQIVPPPDGAVVAEGTTRFCGTWHIVAAKDECVDLCVKYEIDSGLFLDVNPSLGTSTAGCTSLLRENRAYCVAPYRDWEWMEHGDQEGDEDEDED